MVQSQGVLAAAAAPDTPVRDHPPAAPSDVGSDGDSTGSPDSVFGPRPARRGYARFACFTVDQFCIAVLYGRTGRLTVKTGDSRPGQL